MGTKFCGCRHGAGSPRNRAPAFHLSAVKGLSTREVARMLQVSAGQVYLIRHRLAKEVKREVERLKKKPL